MDEINFLTLEMVLEIHRDQIESCGGTLGIRDPAILQSAVSMPQAGFGDDYLHKDIFEMTAAYLFHLTQGHPFLDGNKRVGAVAAFMFLWLNDIVVTADEDEFEKLVLDVAQGLVQKPVIAKFFKKNSKQR